MNYFLISVPVITGITGEILTDNPEVSARISDAIQLTERNFDLSDFKWKRAYYWPGDDYYIYVSTDLSLSELNAKFGSVYKIWEQLQLSDRSYKYNNSGELTIQEYMNS